jgi:hypothetical protein
MATAEELVVIRNIRREFSKTLLDTTRLEISFLKGTIYLTGGVSVLREAVGVSCHAEMEELILKISKWENIRSVVNGCKMIEQQKPEPRHRAL